MGVRKLTKFLGTAPKLSPELLPDTAAQRCVNSNLYSGDLIPYRDSVAVGTNARSGVVNTIYPMMNGSTKVWLSWETDVDVAIASSSNDDSQRIYYTGDGVPKMTTYDLAVTGSLPYPASGGYYELGLPLPTTTPIATAAALSTISITNIERDGDNIATVTTGSNHGYRTGNYITISGFNVISDTYSSNATADTITVALSDPDVSVGGTVSLTFLSGTLASAIGFGTYKVKSSTASDFTVTSPNVSATSGNVDIDVTSFNVQSAYITVIDDTSFSVFSGGPEVSDVAGTFTSIYGSACEVILAGTEVGRSYVYTWMTPFAEESIPSEPSETIYVHEGQQVTISGLPTAKPSGVNFIRGFRLYRSVTDTTGSSYFRLRTVWFPNDFTFMERTSNVVTATTEFPHVLGKDDLIKIDNTAFGGAPDTSFDVTDEVVIEVIDDYTFTYAATGSDKTETATTAGTLYYDIAEYNSGESRFYESTTFVDNYDVGGLAVTLSSLYADAPEATMIGLKAAHNNILIGFFANELCFAEPSKPWSWPQRYRLTFPDDIVAVEPMAGSILVLTERFPYLVAGSTPENMTSSRIDAILPCVSKRSVVNMGYGVVYASNGGLALYGTQTGPQLISNLVHHYSTWDTTLDPTSIVGYFFDGKYFGSHSGGSFLFERDDQVGGFLVTSNERFLSGYYDSVEGVFYFTDTSTDGKVYEWDEPDQPYKVQEWKSKVFVAEGYVGIGAMRVVADYTGSAEDALAVLAYNATVPGLNTAIWGYIDQLGTMNGPTDYTNPDTSAWTTNSGTFNAITLNGGNHMVNLLPTSGVSAATVKLWANKELVFDNTVTNSEIFRIPSALRSDTWEVSVSGAVRIRAIHMGETPAGLRNI